MPARPVTAALVTLALSLLGHALLLGGGQPHERPRTTRAVLVAQRPPPAMPPATPIPLPEPENPAVPAPRREQAPAPAQPPETATPLEAPTAPALRLGGPAEWIYRLRQGGQDGEALLSWQPQADGHYSLRLTRRIGERALPAWHSQGRLDSSGLAPERFAQQLGGRDRLATNFDTQGGRVSFSASPAIHPRPDGAQDRLSWWLQLATLVQADPRPGGRWRLWVAGLRGELREWVFEAIDPDGMSPVGQLRLQRLPLGPHDPGLELWLDPDRGYWPVRLRQGDPEGRGFEIRLAEPADAVNS
ncbi:MAG: hypothetical protein DI603_10675 [Roseateles depolymerans]|uniref:DUF3108 domain-containing protein n=1 Tax=Roseateles depolymerans TaxID=76731 RepID=A0A2W5DRW1_9BURK|nr:MAG: hypothetical protein DI603_10675 [Roseateles depolymerans]